jgi:hypothetical protein
MVTAVEKAVKLPRTPFHPYIGKNRCGQQPFRDPPDQRSFSI